MYFQNSATESVVAILERLAFGVFSLHMVTLKTQKHIMRNIGNTLVLYLLMLISFEFVVYRRSMTGRSTHNE